METGAGSGGGGMRSRAGDTGGLGALFFDTVRRSFSGAPRLRLRISSINAFAPLEVTIELVTSRPSVWANSSAMVIFHSFFGIRVMRVSIRCLSARDCWFI